MLLHIGCIAYAPLNLVIKRVRHKWHHMQVLVAGLTVCARAKTS